MIILAFLILGLLVAVGLMGAAKIKADSDALFHVKPRMAFAQATILGRTEADETVQYTATLFEDESEAQWALKQNKLFEMREKRLGFQNDRMIAIQEEQRKHIEAEKAKGNPILSAVKP